MLTHLSRREGDELDSVAFKQETANTMTSNRARDELDMTEKNTLLEIRERAKLVAVSDLYIWTN